MAGAAALGAVVYATMGGKQECKADNVVDAVDAAAISTVDAAKRVADTVTKAVVGDTNLRNPEEDADLVLAAAMVGTTPSKLLAGSNPEETFEIKAEKDDNPFEFEFLEGGNVEHIPPEGAVNRVIKGTVATAVRYAEYVGAVSNDTAEDYEDWAERAIRGEDVEKFFDIAPQEPPFGE